MSYWMNDYDIDRALEQIDPDEAPNLALAVRIVDRLRRWTDSNSDGWPYWQAPSKAAGKLMDLIHSRERHIIGWHEDQEIAAAELRKALTPLKTFLTKQGVEHSLILEDPEPYCNHDEPALVDQGDGTVKCECGAVLRPVTIYTAV